MLRRFRLYFTGFVIGLIVVYFYFWRDDSRDLDIWTPEQRILEAIRNDSTFQSSAELLCLKHCLALTDETLNSLWTEGEVKSINPGGDPYIYQIELEIYEMHLNAILEKRGELHSMTSLSDLNTPKACDCVDDH